MALIFDNESKTIQWKKEKQIQQVIIRLKGCLHIEECSSPMSVTLHKSQIKVDQKYQHKN